MSRICETMYSATVGRALLFGYFLTKSSAATSLAFTSAALSTAFAAFASSAVSFGLSSLAWKTEALNAAELMTSVSEQIASAYENIVLNFMIRLFVDKINFERR